MKKIRQEVLNQAANTHRESLRKNLQHRIEVARSQGNDTLVSQLEAEAAYLHFK